MDGLDLAVDAHWLEDVLLDPDLEPTLLTTQEATRLVERRHEPERGSYAELQQLVSRLDYGRDGDDGDDRGRDRSLEDSPSQGSLDGSLGWDDPDSPDRFDSPDGRPIRYAAPYSRSASRSADDPPFTFAPHIRQPKRYAPRLPFKQRNELWQRGAKQRLAEAKRRKESREMLECSFRPQVSRSSQDSPRRSGTESFETRLYRQPPSKEKAREKVLADRERQLEEQCTFRPNTADSKRTYGKAMQQQSFDVTGLSSKRSHSTIEEEPSFRPMTNAVPERMETAKAYLAENVFTRLSSFDPAPEPEPEEPRPGFDQEALFDFLTRQNEREEARLDRLEKLAQETQAPFQPALCARSRQLARTGATSRFGYTAPRRQASEPAPDPEATYEPKISRKAQRMPSRGVADMSAGDARRRELAQQKVMERLQPAQLADTAPEAFARLPAEVREKCERNLAKALQPERAKSAVRGAQGRVNADQALSDYIQRLRRKDQAIVARADESQASREARDLEGCTFAPTIRKAPSYVSRMASASRARREAVPREAPGRPEWR